MSEWISVDSDIYKQYMQGIPPVGSTKEPDIVDSQHFKAHLQSFVMKNYGCLVEWNKGFDL